VKTEANHPVGVSKMVARGSLRKLEKSIAANVAGILGA
jgi:hypothetical protein